MVIDVSICVYYLFSHFKDTCHFRLQKVPEEEHFDKSHIP